jgi:sugar phosphate isomerase/epimerase
MAMEYIKQAGFCYVDYSFDMDADYKNGIYSSDFDGYIDKIKRKADLLGLTFVQAHSPLGKPIAEENSAFVEDTIKCVRACSKLGIKNLVVHSGYDFNISKEETFEKNKAFYNKILCEAEKYEINILTENFNKMCIENLYWIDNASDLLKLIEYVDHPLFHAVWDTGHANMQKTPQDECLRLLGNHVYALHVHDNFGDEESDRLIATIASIIKDNAKPEYIVGRVDGDVFNVIIPMPEDGEAEEYSKAVQNACDAFEDEHLAPSVATGVAYKTNVEASMENVFSDAEVEMLENKIFIKNSEEYCKRLQKKL